MLIDGCQAVVHETVDVQALDADFYVFSGHKLYGPTGIGVLHGKAERLAAMPPYQGGGEMIDSVPQERITYADPPTRFEAGTPGDPRGGRPRARRSTGWRASTAPPSPPTSTPSTTG